MVFATALYNSVKKGNKKKELLADGSSSKATLEEESNPAFMIMELLVGVIAVYLSWTCNTKAGIEVPMKIFYALFAYVFGILYLLYYAFARYSDCSSPTGGAPIVRN